MAKLNEILWVLVSVVIVLSVAGGAFVFASKPVSSEYSNIDEFAQYLTDNGVVMYGASWCSHCKAEKDAFGDSFKSVTYVECPDNIAVCTDKGVTSFPTWILKDGTKLVGTQGLQRLADATGFELKK